MEDIGNALYDAAKNLREQFLNDPTEENADNLNTAMRMLYKFVILSNQYALKYADMIYDKDAANARKYFLSTLR